jgi:hypothetical protein
MEIFLVIFAFLLALAGWALWFDRRQRRRGAPVGDVASNAERLRSRDQSRGVGPTDSGGWGGAGL